MNFYSILTVLLSISASPAFATVTGIAFGDDTASRIETIAGTTGGGTTGGTTTTTNTYRVTAGFAGLYGDCSTPPVADNVVCNSCTGLGDLVTGNSRCAERSIYPDLKFAATVTLDTLPANPRILAQLNGTGTLTVDSGSSISGNSFTIYIPWSVICSELNLTTSCTNGTDAEVAADLTIGLGDSGSTGFASGATQVIRIRIRTVTPTTAPLTIEPDREEPIANSEFTDFQVLPGDEKVYLKDIWRGGVGPAGSAEIKWQALRLYFAEDVNNAHDFTQITYNGDNYADFTVEDKENINTSLGSGRLTGLENEVEYMFNIASVDEATIVSGFLNPQTLTNLSPEQNSRYRATPGSVVGLLDSKECFIATAAYGSRMDEHVTLLRKFRTEILGSSKIGRSFIRFYYQHSPPVAKFIAEHETLRTIVRWSLWPVVFMADMSLKFGFGIVFIFLLSAIFSTTGLIVQFRRRA